MSENNEKRTIGKVTLSAAGGVGITGAITTLILWIISPGAVEPEVLAVAIATLIMSGGALIGGWLVKPGDGKRRSDG